MDKALVEQLRVWAAQYNTPAFIPDDPVSFPHRFSDRLDIEVSAFLTAWIAYGRREHILAKAGLLHDWMGESPYAFIMEADDEFAVLRGEAGEGRRDTFYRFYTFADLRRLCRRLREIYRRYGSLEAAFASIPAGECPTRRLRRLFPDIVGIPSVTSGCACKRLAMFLRWMGTAPEVLPDAIAYFRYYFIGVLAVVMYNMCKSIMNALGDSKRPLYYLIISSLTNIVLDLLFIGAFHWGVWAAAVATTISQAVSMILCMIHLMKKGTIYQVELKKLHIDREMLGQIVRYGLPSGVQNSVIGFANVIVQSNINSFGKVAMAAYGAYSKLEGFAFLPVTSFTMALTTFVGQNLGAGLHDRAKQGSRFGIIASVVIAELIGVTMYLLAPQLVTFFSPTPDVIALGTRQMRTTALFFCLLAYSHAVASICRGAGKAFVPMVIMLLFWCVVRIAYITIVMGIVHEIQYIYMAYPITWSLSSIVYFLYYHFSDWVHGFEKKPAKS